VALCDVCKRRALVYSGLFATDAHSAMPAAGAAAMAAIHDFPPDLPTFWGGF
jgi:hypothetical protein